MADVKLNTLPQSTSPTSTQDLLLFDESTNAGQRINYNTLADVILAKLTSKTYTVGGGTQTLISAIDALNSNFAGSISKAVNSWTDAIEAAKNANYRIVSVRINGTDSQNLPTGFNVHWGTIYCNPGGTYGAAILQSFSGDIYTKGLSAGTWTDWQKQPTRAEMDTLKVGTPINHMRFFGNNNKTYDILRFCYDESESEYIQVIFDVNDKSIALYKKPTDGTETFIGKVTLT